MPRRWIPITLLSLCAIGLLAAAISLAVGEKRISEIELDETGEVQELVAGIRQLDDRLGEDDAPVQIFLFTDVQCPRCAEFQADVVDPLIASHVRTGDVKLLFRNFPLGLKPVTLGALAVEAAAMQDRGWQYAEIFIRNLDQVPEQGVSEEYLNEVAAFTPKLDTARWESDVMSAAAREAAEADVEQATELRLPADPILIVEGAGGSEQLEDVPTLEEVEAAIERVR
jgi:protein-disulfide isomerase